METGEGEGGITFPQVTSYLSLFHKSRCSIVRQENGGRQHFLCKETQAVQMRQSIFPCISSITRASCFSSSTISHFCLNNVLICTDVRRCWGMFAAKKKRFIMVCLRGTCWVYIFGLIGSITHHRFSVTLFLSCALAFFYSAKINYYSWFYRITSPPLTLPFFYSVVK